MLCIMNTIDFQIEIEYRHNYSLYYIKMKTNKSLTAGGELFRQFELILKQSYRIELSEKAKRGWVNRRKAIHTKRFGV